MGTITPINLSEHPQALLNQAFAQHESKAALVCDGKVLTYRELEEEVESVASNIRHKAMLTHSNAHYVALYLDRGIDMVIGILAAIRAGMAYIPISTEAPAERCQFILEDSQAAIVLTHKHYKDAPHLGHTAQVWIESPVSQNIEPVHSALTDIAYVIYTSGTTGTPKGVEIPYQNLHYLAEAQIERFQLDKVDRVLLFASYIFDASVFELIVPILLGHTVYIATEAERKDEKALGRLLKSNAIQFASIPPALLALMEPEDLNTLETLVVAGETPNLEMLQNLSRITRIFNGYGPTEYTVGACANEFSLEDNEFTIGTPFVHTRFYVLDEQLAPVSQGDQGELYISGAGIAKGYLNRPELTKARFIDNPYYHPHRDPSHFAKLYKTGDLVRFDGERYHFIGRNDNQIKLRGFRIELGEIEQVIAQHDAVKLVSCQVVTRGSAKFLVAFLVTHQALDSQLVQSINGIAKKTLPSYMIPDHYQRLEALPMTENGKVDAHELSHYELTSAQDESDITLSRTQQDFLAQFQSFCLPGLQWQQDFFQQGGDSLSVINLSNQLFQQLGISVPATLIYRHRSAAQVWQALQSNQFETVALPKRDAKYQNTVPLSLQQRAIWFLAKADPNDKAYHAKCTTTFSGEFNVAAMQGAIQDVVAHHDVFRTYYDLHQPIQYIDPDYQQDVPYFDFSNYPEATALEHVDQLVNGEMNDVFAINMLPLARFAIVKINDTKHILIHIEHHLVHDGWSSNIFINHLFSCYKQRLNGAHQGQLPEITQYADYAAYQHDWLRSDQATQQREFWKAQLKDAPSRINLPVSRLGETPTARGKAHRVKLPRALWDNLKRFSQQHQVTPFSVALAALNVVLSRFSGDQDICIGSGVANRSYTNVENTIGMLVSTVVARVQQTPEMRVDALIQHCFDVSNDMLANQTLPFTEVVADVNPERIQGVNPLFQICFSFHDSPLPDLTLPGLDNIDYYEAISSQSSKFELNIVVITRMGQDQDDSVTMLWEFDLTRYDPWFIDTLSDSFNDVLSQLINVEGSTTIEQLPLAGNLVHNVSTAEHPKQDLLSLFNQQVQSRSAQTALITSEGTLSYQALSDRADKVAAYLITQFGKQDFIGLYLQPSVETIIAMLAVIKSGAAYVPLSTRAPAARNRFIIEDAKLEVVLSDTKSISTLSSIERDEWPLLNLDKDITDCDATLPMATPKSNAYVIYTSGTTGQPKGVIQNHENVSRLLQATQPDFQFSAQDTWVLYHDTIFDFSVWEIWGALCHGAKLFIPSYEEVRDSFTFVKQCEQYGVTILNQTPSAFYNFSDVAIESGAKLNTLKTVIFGGEQLNYTRLTAWWQHFGQTINLINMYGITETTVHVTALPLHPDMNTAIADIGKPLNDMTAFVLDNQLRQVPVGVPGELFIAGAGLAVGYLNQPKLTNQRFFTLTIDSQQIRVYKTGDKARQLPNGHLEYLGRLDNQIKIRGHRIELGEIESQLLQCEGVKEAAVITYERQQQTALSGYVVMENHAIFDDEYLLNQLRTHLPTYMVPDSITELSVMPLTVNGKLNHKALPLPQRNTPDTYTPPRTALEQTLCDVWQTTLELEQVGIHDNFYRLGGNSILAVQLVRNAQKWHQLAIPLSAIIACPSVAALAQYLNTMTLTEINATEDTSQPRSAQVMEL
ncbi:non-ribosomal peptide synthetase [Pseudoalteromonas piscicida]|uniref:Non-ribosomal peptide synthetase n=1 Tax=Pseudoalteromonas piscicida TaxID=43662 RepID=A0A2A5JKR4_PSEO7|nr:non-ribosomal peptide synthetase [Pseudoalteromonas piscicida]PCK30023.1 non-ribosomal peptide synthetase [Pseudoalteromonas piscicida]